MTRFAKDRIVVTENAEDFRKLAAAVDLHPGLIILPSIARLEAQRLMDLVIDYPPSRERRPPSGYPREFSADHHCGGVD
jgi:hypothetical protein